MVHKVGRWRPGDCLYMIGVCSFEVMLTFPTIICMIISILSTTCTCRFHARRVMSQPPALVINASLGKRGAQKTNTYSWIDGVHAHIDLNFEFNAAGNRWWFEANSVRMTSFEHSFNCHRGGLV